MDAELREVSRSRFGNSGDLGVTNHCSLEVEISLDTIVAIVMVGRQARRGVQVLLCSWTQTQELN